VLAKHVLTASWPLVARRPSVNTTVVCDHFGVSAEAGRVCVADDVPVTVEPGDVVLFVGPSGSGKSTLLRCLAAQLGLEAAVVDSAAVSLCERALVDELPMRVDAGMELLATLGLGEARLLLRSAAELSEGQRYRYRLAMSVALAKPGGWIVADEFTATLDRTLAKIVAFGVRRVADRRGCGFLLATTHEDISDDLAPDVVVRCLGDGDVRVTRTAENAAESGVLETVGRKKKDSSVSPGSSSLRPERGAIGRTSLGGITGVRDSASCGT
jgi:ABC-type ATPase with predicted acetyltransferase domain